MPYPDSRAAVGKASSVLPVSSFVTTTLAVAHIANWAFSVVLGVTAVWIRTQEGPQTVTSFFGTVGIGCWASLPVSAVVKMVWRS